MILYLPAVNEVRDIPDAYALDEYIKKIACNDSEALAALYQKTSVSVYSYALSILKNVHDAEDVLHDCYLAIHSAAVNYKSDGKPMAWIITIAKNLCLMKLRERKKSAETENDSFFIDAHYNESVMSSEDSLILSECMNELSAEERQIVTLHAVSGFKHREIAQIMDMALPTVLSKYNRALKKLKKSLSKGER